jgi:hypothetical protein
MFVVARRAVRPVIRTSLNQNCGSIILRPVSSMTNESIPVVLIGRTSEVGKMVTEALKPEYEGQSCLIPR